MSEAALEAEMIGQEEGVYAVEITPNNIRFWWPVIKPGLIKMRHHFASHGDPVGEITAAVLSGDAQCWVGANVVDKDGPPNPKVVMITTVIDDALTSGRYLLIYALWAYEKMGREMVELGRDVLLTFARRMECTKIVAQVQDPLMERYMRTLPWFTNEIKYFIAEVE